MMLFVTKRRPTREQFARVVSGKRGEIGVPADPAKGAVWSSIVKHYDEVGYEDRWIAVSDVPQTTLCNHPWSIGSDAETAITAQLNNFPRLLELGAEAGPAIIIIEDEAFFRRYSRKLPLRRVVDGADVRDWAIVTKGASIIYPYADSDLCPVEDAAIDLWQLRTTLGERHTFVGTFKSNHRPWYEFERNKEDRIGIDVSRIVFSEIGTNSHFVYDASDAISTRTAPVIMLQNANEELCSDVAAVLNSSVMEFWFKQRCRAKGGDKVSGGRVPGENWEERYVRNGTNVVQAPYDPDGCASRRSIIMQIRDVVESRRVNEPSRVLSKAAPDDIESMLARAHENDERDIARLVFLQEELDWLTYRNFGLTNDAPILDVSEPRILRRGDRPFEIALALRVERGDEKTKWFVRHQIREVTSVPDDYDEAYRAVLAARVALAEADEVLKLLEQPVYKRRWITIPWGERVSSAATDILSDSLEAILQAAGPTRPLTLDEIVYRIQQDSKILAVAALLSTEASQFARSVREVLDANSVPDAPSRLFKPSGLLKLIGDAVVGIPDAAEPFSPGDVTDWKRVWRLQEREDAGETIEQMPVPPPFKPIDYAHSNGWKLRGKFNVANERFIVYEDVTPKRYGWGGWTTAERARASLEIFQLRNYEDEGAPERPSDDPLRCPIQFALWDKLDELRRLADPIESSVRSIADVCEAHCPCPVLKRWRDALVENKANSVRAGSGKAHSDSVELVEPGEAATRPLDAAIVLGVHARIRSAGKRGRSIANLLVAAAGDEALLRRALAALRARGEIDVIGKGRGTRYVDPREVERLAAAELPLL